LKSWPRQTAQELFEGTAVIFLGAGASVGDDSLGGEAPVELLRRGETGRVVSLLLSAGSGLP
jgi:hypothetical protein